MSTHAGMHRFANKRTIFLKNEIQMMTVSMNLTIKNCLLYQVTKIKWVWPWKIPTLTRVHRWYLPCGKAKWDENIA